MLRGKEEMNRRTFSRKSGQRLYRKIFFIVTEGTNTEPQYFDSFESDKVRIKLAQGSSKTSPRSLISRVKNLIKTEIPKATDEIWIVLDKDNWNDQQLLPIVSWSKESDNYNFALSNPKFEYWLLLHFEDSNISSSNDCSQKLKKHMPNYDKNLDMRKITNDMINNAIKRAKQRDIPPCDKWPTTFGSTVYRLVENIVKLNHE
jgi:hypothetical protein